MKSTKQLFKKLNRLGSLPTASRAFSEGPKLPEVDFEPMPYNGPSYDECLQMRRDHMPSGSITFYKEPLLLVQGKNQYLFDQDGKRYLDMFAGIVTVSVGHSHPRIVEVATKQINTLMHTTQIYVNDQVSQYAKELTDKFADPLDTVFFTNSGSEANDMAVRLARLHSGNYTIVGLRNAYHGMSGVTTGLTNTPMWKHNIPETFGLERTLVPDLYKGMFTGEGAVESYIRDYKEVLQYQTSGSVAAFICETIQGVGGVVDIPAEYIQEAYKLTREHGGLCIADEVQSGFGRTGTHFWGYERKDVVPDIVVVAKGIGNGIPLGAVITTKAIADSMSRLTLNTYGGNQIASAIGREVLKIIDEEGLQENCRVMGNHLKEGLHYLMDKYEIIGDVRGEGLMLGAEVVVDKESKVANDRACNNVFERTKELGLVIGKTRNIFRLKPPMIITKEDCDFTIAVLDQALQEEKDGKLKWF